MALASKGGIQLLGLEPLQRAVSKAADQDLKTRMGKAHQKVGQHIIDQWLSPKPDPRAVGEGRGAKIRASRARGAVQLMAGGKHRQDGRGPDAPKEQWGVRPVGQIGPKPDRPHIIQTARDHTDEILGIYWDAVAEAMEPAFYDVKDG